MDKQLLLQRIAELREALNDAEQKLAQLEDSESEHPVTFAELFDLEEIQTIQDNFAEATGVGSLITSPEGVPLTRPSNFCRLCNDIIRKTEKGRRRCKRSDSILGCHNPHGPTMRKCLSAGLWDAGASITVNGRHLASWLVGQIRNEELEESAILAYAQDIGADPGEFASAFEEVTIMPLEQFKKICDFLFLLANILSLMAYQNLKLRTNVAELSASHTEVSHLRNFLSNIIDSMPSILVGVDPAGKVTHWNMRAADATGLDKTQARGRHLADVLPLLSDKMGKVIQAIREREPLIGDTFQEISDGALRYNDVSIYPLIANGVEGAVIRVDDVTERVRIEELIIQSEKMLSVGGLAAGIAHEVNNPLAVITGNSRLLEKRLVEDAPQNRKKAEECGTTYEAITSYIRSRGIDTMLKAIAESSRQAERVVTNMLGFSRKSDGVYGYHDVRTILEKALALVKSGQSPEHDYNFKDIIVIREYMENIPKVYCEPTNLQQAFFNILKNGAQAMLDYHATSRRPPRFILRCRYTTPDIRIEIEDNGPGMAPETLRRVFEPFFTTKGIGVGTGLGMSIAYFIVSKSLAGRLAATSCRGHGATFIIELPVDGKKEKDKNC